MTVTAVPDTRVLNGIAVLDEHAPGWRDRIDRDRLDMQNPCECVLGQLYGDFYSGVKWLGLTYEHVDRLGFDTINNEEFAELTEAWKEEIR